jgi:hypothetical protein
MVSMLGTLTLPTRRHTSQVAKRAQTPQTRAQTRVSRKPARKLVDDVTYPAACEQQIVYTYLRPLTSHDTR